MQKSPLRYGKNFATAYLLTALAACGGGGGGSGGITLSTGDQGEDPVVLEIPIAYIKRPLPEETSDLRDPLAFNPGARLYVREHSSTSADEVDITKQMTAIIAEEEGVSEENLSIDIKDLESAYDGKSIIFSARAVTEPVANNLENTTWNLWLLNLETMQADYLIPSRIKRNEGMEAGGGQDIAPHFLPDDRIVFSSTRQVASQARQLNEGRIQLFSALDEDGDEPAAVLHIYDPQQRNQEFSQISFNRSHDLDPTVLSSGEVLFSRWNNTATDHISLFRIEPAGSALSPLYGFHSQRVGTDGAAIEYTQARELDDGRVIALAKGFRPDSLGGEVIVIDADAHVEYDQAVWANQGDDSAGHVSLTTTEVRTDQQISPGGQFGSVYPLRDGTGRLLLTWSECRVIDEDAAVAAGTTPAAGDYVPCTLQPDNRNSAPPLYGAWVYDPAADIQRPVVLAQEGFLISEVIAVEPRDYPDLIPQSGNFDGALALEMQGQLRIDSVYDLDGEDNSPEGIRRHATPGTDAFSNRPARFLRIVQPVPIPQREIFDIPRYAYGVSAAFSFREIAGYVPVEPDGSVTVNVPAARPFTISVLDDRGRRIGPRHNYWLQVAPGERLHCTGCHTTGNPLPHGRLDSQPESANPGARSLASGNTGFSRTDTSRLFATEVGETMAEVWDFHNPIDNATAAERELSLHPQYSDQWNGPGVSADADIQDRAYDAGWTDIPANRGIVVNNLDPTLPGRIVINYMDHIQPIWDRIRPAVPDSEGVLIENCVGCHSDSDGTLVAAGQLDLTPLPSDIDADHYRSYRELLSADAQQWVDTGGAVSDRQRICTTTDADGNILTSTETIALAPPMQAGFANGSSGFFACFEGGPCGPDSAPPLPQNCIEGDGTPIAATSNTVNHIGLLSESELRLISEWLDIGAQYFNNPFDSRLAD